MKELFEYSVIKGLVFSTYDKLGPQPFYMFPEYISDNQFKEYSAENDEKNRFKLTLRDYTQISIKNLSLFISDSTISGDDDFQNIQYFSSKSS